MMLKVTLVLVVVLCRANAASITPAKSADLPYDANNPLPNNGGLSISDGDFEERGNAPELFEGDIAGIIEPGDSDESIRKKLDRRTKAGVVANTFKWWNADVYYEMSSALTSSERAKVMTAFREFEKTDTVRFYPRSTQTDYIYIQKSDQGCYAHVGKIGGMQIVNLEAPGCWTHGIIVHELNHAIGFWHEQSRYDRDSYVELNLNNVDSSNHHNFLKYDSGSVTHANTPYDYGSLMHYGKTAFALSSNVWTIRPKAPWQNREIGQRIQLSPTDIAEINSMYPLCGILYEDDAKEGPYSQFVKNVVANLHPSSYDIFSSAFVRPGCRMTIYSLVNHEGTATSFTANSGPTYHWSFVGKPYDNDARSVKCEC
ncbi:putative Zinc metalloproteinase nas-14 [Hypsibius exemplaris]|uniref:Metalloendopeptidase n=1 Tax=Hypsibius exemplaris TaxID=2072580 RepID=A0A1W0XDQ6_HYPEX|nr:putative Zinc metalloproteinase nas-14 [Hypsibius exemplaris]